MNRRAAILLLIVSVAFAGCDWFRSKKEPLPGERISVLQLANRLEPDPQLARIAITLPPVKADRDWPQTGGDTTHAMSRPALPGKLNQAWQHSVGEGSSRYTRVEAQPIVADGRVYAMDGGVQASAYDVRTGRQIWQNDLKPKGDRGNSFGGGLAFWHGRLYAATGYAEVLALDPASGKVIWRKSIGAPARSAPTVANNRIFVLTTDDRLVVAATDDGHQLWTHSGIPETAGLTGGASPAVEGDVVVVGYSSGELYALAVENGRVLWSDNLAAARTAAAIASLSDIHGNPVIDRGRVYAISHSGRMVAIDLRTGQEIWDREIGGVHTPWTAGDYVYVVTNGGELLCLTRNEGKVRWMHPLPRYQDPGDKSGPIEWDGPVLGGDRLIVLSSTGKALALSPYDGKKLGGWELPAAAFVEPAIASRTLYVLSDDATLTAYR